MASNGLNLGVGIDLSKFDKDISYVNKKLKTVGGQVELATIKFKNSDNPLVKQIQEAQKMYEKAFDGMSRVLYEKIGKNGKLEIFDINNVKEAEEAVAYLKKQLAKVEKSNNPNKDKLVSSYTQQIADVNQYIIAVGKLSDAFAKAGLASMPKGDRARLAERSAISEEIKLLQQKQSLNQQNTQISDHTKLNEEIRLQKELISLLEKKQSTYKNGYNKNVTTQINAARNELEVLRQRAKQISENNRLRKSEASTIDKINNLEKKRAATKGLNNQIARYQQERIIVSRLVTQWERYLAIATKLNNTTGVANANAKLDALRKEEIALRNLEKTERNRIALRNQNAAMANQSGILSNLKNLATRYFSIYTAFNIAKQIAETTGYFKQQQVALEGIIGSATKAREVLSDIQDFALKSPFQTKDLVQFTKQLSAFGVNSDELFPTVTKLADISAGLGVDMSRIILAYGQVKSASVLRGQELRQFTEAGIPMVDALAKKLTELNGRLVTTGEVFEFISDRKVSFEMVAEVLSDMTSEGGRFYNMQENLTNTLYGQIQKLKDMWTLAMKDSGNSIANTLMGIVKALQTLLEHAKGILSGVLTFAISRGLSKIMTSLPVALAAAKTSLGRIKLSLVGIKTGFTSASASASRFGTICRGLAGTVRGIFGFLTNPIVAFGASLLVGYFVDAKEKANEFKRSIDDINDTFDKELNSQKDGLDKLISKLSTLTKGTKEYEDVINSLKSNYGDYINDSLIEMLTQEENQLYNTAKGWNSLHESIKLAIDEKSKLNRLTAIQDTSLEHMKKYLSVEGLRSTLINTHYTGATNWVWDKIDRLFGTEKGDFSVILDMSGDKISKALEEALGTYLGEIGSNVTKGTLEQFKGILEKSLVSHGVPEKFTTVVLSNAEAILATVADSQEFKTWAKSYDDLVNSPLYQIKTKFKERKALSEGKLRDETNPYASEAYLSSTITETMLVLLDEYVIKPANLDDTKIREYRKLLTKDFVEDSGISYDIANTLLELKDQLKDQELISRFNEIYSNYYDIVTLTSGRARDIANKIKTTHVGTSLSLEEINFMKRYVPTDANVDELRRQIEEDYDSIDKKIKSYGDTQVGENAKYVETLKKQLEWLNILKGEEYYDIDDSDKNNAKSEQLSSELNDFLNTLKTAYQRYNEAVSKGGIGIGLDYVKNNEMFTEMFGAFFHGVNSDAFKELANLKVGNNTVGALLKDKFLADDLEGGVLDFRSAVMEVAKDLEDYGKADKENRKAYLAVAKQLRQWADSTFSKDNLDATLKKLELSVKELTSSFEMMNKEVDLYGELLKKGTVSTLGNGLSVTEKDFLTPDSDRIAKNVENLISQINNQLPENVDKINVGNLSDLNAIREIIDVLKEPRMLNEEAFDGTALGRIGEELIKELEGLDSTIRSEMKSISGESYSGNALDDAIANALMRIDSETALSKKQMNVGLKYGHFDQSVINKLAKANEEEAKKIFDAFISSINLDVLGRANNFYINPKIVDNLENQLTSIADKLPSTLFDELYSKLQNLKDSISDYNAKAGSASAFFDAIRDYRGADEYAKDKWEKESKINASIANQLYTPELRALLTDEEIMDLEVQLALSNERLKEMGGSAEAFAEKLKRASLERLQRSLSEFQNKFNAIKSSVDEAIGTFKTLSDSIRKVYDMLSKGEEPEWMKEMDSFLGDFGEAFEALVAPMMAIISLVATLTIAFVACEAAMTPLLIAMVAIIAVGAIVAGIIAAVNAKDNRLQRTIEDLEKQINDTQNAISNLNSEMGRMVGYEKLEASLKSLSLTYDNFRDAQAQAKAELAKPHKFDEEKYKEYLQNAKGYLNDFYDGIKEFTEGLTFSIEDIAGRISDAMRSAFQNGTNAARDMAVAVKESIGDVVENMMRVTFLEPMIKSAFETFIGGSEEELRDKFTYTENGIEKWDSDKALEYLMNRLSDPELLSNLENDFNAASEGYLEFFNSLDKTLQDYFSYNADSSSSLSGGISGITEDTARQLEGLGNSQLMQLITINRTLSQYLDNMDNYSQSQYMANVQTHLVSIDGNVSAILSLLRDMRAPNGRAMKVSME